jgi:hypothetical protein
MAARPWQLGNSKVRTKVSEAEPAAAADRGRTTPAATCSWVAVPMQSAWTFAEAIGWVPQLRR